MENWKKYKLKELVELKSGYAFKGTDFISAGVPVIKIKNVKPGKIVFDNLSYVSREVANKTQNFRILPNDILITMSGNRIEGTPETWVGKAALFKHNGEFLLNQRVGILKVKDTNSVSEVFLSLLLSSKGFQYHFISKATSSGGQANISPSLIYGTDVTIPPIEEQKAIAKILSSLDDKIELNRQMKATLEAMAKALFKAWFIDFEPVRAKMENRPSESASPEIAKLFPSEFENTIPKGWRVDELRNHLEVVRGLSYKGSGLCEKDSGVPMNNLNSVYEGGGYKHEGIKYYNGEYKEKHLTKAGDIIVANTEQGHKHLLIGFPAIVPQYLGETSIFSHHIYRIRPNNRTYLKPQFIYYLLLSSMIRETIIGCSSGTTVNMLKIDGLQIPKFTIPTEKVLTNFSRVIENIWRKQELLYKENQTLTQIRDSLLPRLISGKISMTALESKMESGA
jgi:type I restriction enzyme S subunit